MGMLRARPSHEILSGDSADVYFARADAILDEEGLDPLVTMEVFAREDAVLCGIDEAKNLLGHVLASADLEETCLESLDDGDVIAPKEVVLRIRARLDQSGFHHVKVVVSGGLTPDRIGYFKEAGAPVDSYAVGSYISGATPIDFTGDIKEIDGRPIAKRGRIPGLTDSPRLRPVDLVTYREP